MEVAALRIHTRRMPDGDSVAEILFLTPKKGSEYSTDTDLPHRFFILSG